MIGRSARLVWGGITLLLLVLLVGSFFLSRGSIDDAENEAERQAVFAANATFADALDAEVVSGDILGPEYSKLLIRVQAEITSDDRVAQVRIWTPEGDLIFSTAQRDKITEYVAEGSPQIERAANGQVNSVVTDTTVAPRAGLAGSDVRLFETFVPLRLGDDASVSAVVQIDQVYEEIRAEGLRVWRPVQIAVAFLLPAAIVLLVLSIRTRDEGEAVAVRAPARVATDVVVVDDRALSDADERAQAAERAAREAESRMAEMEKRLRDADKAGTTPSMLSRVEELDLKLRASEAEREQHVAELQRLRSQLGERDAEVATLRGGAIPPDAARAEKVIAEAERLIAEAEAKASAAAARAGEAEARAADLGGKLKAAEAAAAAAEAAEVGKGKDAEKLAADLQAAAAERDALAGKLAELETTLAGARATILSKDKELQTRTQAATEAAALAEEAAAQAVVVAERIQAAELKAADAEERFVDAQARLEESEAKRASAESRLPELEAGLATLADLESRATRAESALVESTTRLQSVDAALAEAAAELQAANEARTAAEKAAAKAEAARLALAAELEQAKAAVPSSEGPSPEELAARVAELESARRSDIAELQRAQESLANTQVELTTANRKLKETEGRLRELESEGIAVAEPEREPVPVPDYVTRESAIPEPEYEAPVEVASFAARLSSLRQEIAAATQPPPPAPGERQPDEEEGLSLRERLARAAAARHRGPLS